MAKALSAVALPMKRRPWGRRRPPRNLRRPKECRYSNCSLARPLPRIESDGLKQPSPLASSGVPENRLLAYFPIASNTRPPPRFLAIESQAVHDKPAVITPDEYLKVRRDTRGAVDTPGKSLEECLTYLKVPESYWHRVRIANPLERLIEEACRRKKVRGPILDAQAGLSLTHVMLIDGLRYWRGIKITRGHQQKLNTPRAEVGPEAAGT